MIRAHVPHWDDSVADYRAASAATRRRLVRHCEIAYGDDRGETLDLFFPPPDGRPFVRRPVHLFVHGGYWRAFSKTDYSFVADAVTAAGAVAAVVDYALMPLARMATLVAQVRRAAGWLAAHADHFGGDPAAISASGHSAGAHLVSYLICRGPHESREEPGPVRSVLLLSGLYDLAPLTRSFLQPEVRLTDEEVERWSPLRAVPRADAIVTVAVGAAETAPFLEQGRSFAHHLSSAGTRADHVELPGEDHMTVVRALGRPGTPCGALIGTTIAASLSNSEDGADR